MDSSLYNARLAQSTENYKDMFFWMIKFVKENKDHNSQARLLFAEALTKHLKFLLESWRIVSLKEKLVLQKGEADNAKVAAWYREKIIERELKEVNDEATTALQTMISAAN